MASAMEITYLKHSGFAVRVENILMIFDDAQGKPGEGDSLKNGRITKELLESVGRVIWFVSHAHSDHFNREIYEIAEGDRIDFILGTGIDPNCKGYHLNKGEEFSLGGVRIKAYGSTDEGVSFLVKVKDWTLFHAGDLNLWHWRDESSLREIEQAEKDYLEEVTPLIGEEIDFAFFPLDPRMGSQFDAGALHFLMHVKPRVMIPMHWWDRSDAADGFARRNRTKHVEIIALTTPGENLRATKDAEGRILIELHPQGGT